MVNLLRGSENPVRKNDSSLILAGLVALLLAACGGGGGGNKAPTANAGGAQTVASGATVTLNGSLSSDPDGSIAAYLWTQTSGAAVSLTNATSAQASFVAPTVSVATALGFSLVVTDNEGRQSSAASATITVSPPPVTVSGTVTYTRAKISTELFKLDHSDTVNLPARGVVVRIVDAGNQAILAAGVTSDTGAYSFSVPGNTSVSVQLEARLLRDGNQPLPRWNVRVQNGTGTSLTPYRYNSPAFNSTSGSGDVNIPMNIAANGLSTTGPRHSGPFAILDTIYTVIQSTVTAVPTATFPTLSINWGSQQEGAFFTPNPANLMISLRSDLSEDTDEFDQAVIAHEFTHYLQYFLSRADSLGGSHGLGDLLDPRVAFNEGFATGYGAVALDDHLYIDSFVSNGNQFIGGYSVEFNPYTVTPTTPQELSLGKGCWCSESTVWSLVWDLFDSNIDGADGVQLDFPAVWEAMRGTHDTTNAFASIFSFVNAIKTVRPAQAGAIDSLVLAQNIDSSTIDDFATTETHQPFANVLPLYTNITKGTPVVVRSLDDAGPNDTDKFHNRLAAHAFVRFVAPSTETVTVTVTTSNSASTADPDFYVYRAGAFVLAAESESPAPLHNEVATLNVIAGATYIIDAYDCANGCSVVQGTTGDYNLTVRID